MTDAILIRGPHEDAHVRAVHWALGRRGHKSLLWNSARFPVEQGLTLDISPDGGCRSCVRENGQIPQDMDRFTTVWNRRHRDPVLPASLPEEEQDFARRECRTMLRSALEQVSPDAFWVNSLEAQRRDIDKPYQLRTAAATGLVIPPTLFSNDPDEIVAFFDRHNGDVIYKPFAPGKWQVGDEALAVTYTTPLPRSLLKERDVLASAPGIYQARLEKRDEWRLTVMGRTCFSVRLHSQDIPRAQSDWRAAHSEIGIAVDTLPEDIQDACLRYMEAAGLHFATFDFVRTPVDEFVFLEANQGGQFLWKESRLPDLPLLAAFTDFLLSRDSSFRWTGATDSPSFAEYCETEDFEALRVCPEKAQATTTA